MKINEIRFICCKTSSFSRSHFLYGCMCAHIEFVNIKNFGISMGQRKVLMSVNVVVTLCKEVKFTFRCQRSFSAKVQVVDFSFSISGSIGTVAIFVFNIHSFVPSKSFHRLFTIEMRKKNTRFDFKYSNFVTSSHMQSNIFGSSSAFRWHNHVTIARFKTFSHTIESQSSWK